MKKLLAILLCALMLMVSIAPAASALSASVTTNGGEIVFETVFDTVDITGATHIKFDYVIETTVSQGPGWAKQAFGLFDADGKFIESYYSWPSGSLLIPGDLTVDLEGIARGTAVWTLPTVDARKFDFSKVCEFDGYLVANREHELTITNLRAVKGDGTEILLSADCSQSAKEDQVSLYSEGEGIPAVLSNGAYVFNKTWTFDEPLDISLNSYIEFDAGIVPTGTKTKLAEGPGYFNTALTLTDDDGNTFAESEVFTQDSRGYTYNRIWAESFKTTCTTFDFTSVVSATISSSANRPATYYFTDIKAGTAESALDKFGELLDDEVKGPDDARIVIGGNRVPASFEFAFEKTNLSTAYAIAYDYKIEAVSDGARAPAYLSCVAAIFDSKGNFNEWSGTSVLPNETYGSGTVTTIIPRLGAADLTDICEFDIFIDITETAIYTINNLRVVDRYGNTVKALTHTGDENLVSFKGEGEGITTVLGTNGAYEYYDVIEFEPVDLSKYSSLRFDLVISQTLDSHNKLSVGPGYHGQSVMLINTEGQEIEVTTAINHDVRGRQTVKLMLNDKEFDYSCVTAVRVYLLGNRQATYWLENIEAMNSKYKWYSMAEIHELEVNPPVEDDGKKPPVEDSKPETPSDTTKNDETEPAEDVTTDDTSAVEDTSAPAEDDSGCGSVIAGGVAIIGAVALTSVILRRKKED